MTLSEWILAQSGRVVELQTALTAIPALGPENGGRGELARAEFVQDHLRAIGVTAIERVDSPDHRVESGLRPNIIAQIPGRTSTTLWLFGHLDTVPPGDLSAWSSDPFRVCVRDGMIYGRGVEDNQQAVCSMLILAEALSVFPVAPELGLGLVFMSDEEMGSRHGLEWILAKRRELFKENDFYIVPDGGSPDAGLIETAEKAQLWLKFSVQGRQCHASMPACGINAFVAGSALVLALGRLSEIFALREPLFEPPLSTFVPTRHDCTTDAINILPGRDVFYLDCRLLPGCPSEQVLQACRHIADGIASEYGVAIDVDVVHSRAATSTAPDSPVMVPLKRAIAGVYGITARARGIGGATVAAFLREAGLPAVVWSCIENTCHQPDEHSSISATLKDAAVFAAILNSHAGA